MHLTYEAFTLYGGASQLLLLYISLVTSRGNCSSLQQNPSTLPWQRLQAYTMEVWAIPLSLAATEGIAFAFFSWSY